MEKNVTMKTKTKKQATTPITYDLIRKRAKAMEKDTVRFLADLVRTQSFSSKEKNVIAVIKKEMQKIGFDGIRIDGLGNIIGRIGKGKRVIAFDGHVDTVYPGDLAQWKFDPFKSFVKAGKIWGRGTVDQKGGVATMIHAGRIIKELGLNDQFTVLFTATVMEEDCDGLCWQYLLNVEKLKPELVVITEPTNMNIYRGHRARNRKAQRAAQARSVPRQGHGDDFGSEILVSIAMRGGRRCRHSSRPPAHVWRDEGERHRGNPGRGEARWLSGCESLRAEIRRGGLHGQGVSDREILPDLGAG